MAIRATVSAIEMGAVMHALAPLLLNSATGRHRHQQLHHVRRSIDDGSIDHSALTRSARIEDARQ
ncbi:hypothetical protein D3C72_1968740 [compost metagenome]